MLTASNPTLSPANTSAPYEPPMPDLQQYEDITARSEARAACKLPALRTRDAEPVLELNDEDEDQILRDMGF